MSRSWVLAVAVLAVSSLASADACNNNSANNPDSEQSLAIQYVRECTGHADAEVVAVTPDAAGDEGVDLVDLEHADLSADEAFGTDYAGTSNYSEAAWNWWECKDRWSWFRDVRETDRGDETREPIDLAARLGADSTTTTTTTTTTGPDLDDVVEIVTTTTAPPPPAPTSSPPDDTSPATTPPETSAPGESATTTTTAPPSCDPPEKSVPGEKIDWSDCESFVIAGTCTNHDDDHGTGSTSGWSQEILGTVDPAFAGRGISAQYHLASTSDFQQSTTGTVAGDGSFRIYFGVEEELEQYLLDGLDVDLDDGFARIAPPGEGNGHEEVAGPDAGQFFVDGPASGC